MAMKILRGRVKLNNGNEGSGAKPVIFPELDDEDESIAAIPVDLRVDNEEEVKPAKPQQIETEWSNPFAKAGFSFSESYNQFLKELKVKSIEGSPPIYDNSIHTIQYDPSKDYHSIRWTKTDYNSAYEKIDTT